MRNVNLENVLINEAETNQKIRTNKKMFFSQGKIIIFAPSKSLLPKKSNIPSGHTRAVEALSFLNDPSLFLVLRVIQEHKDLKKNFTDWSDNTLSASPTKWSNTLKKLVGWLNESICIIGIGRASTNI